MNAAERLAAVHERITAACRACRRDPATVGLVAVSKTFPLAAIQELKQLGQAVFGENYAQELSIKAAQEPNLSWHFVGRLQTNKARSLAPWVERYHALETVAQAEALVARAPRPVVGLLAVNLAAEASKSGVSAAEALERAQAMAAVPGFRLAGLMTLPPPAEDPEASAPFFAELAELAARGRAAGLPLTELSMGMSHDLEVAIRHGATWVRVGTALFGERSHP